MNARDILPAVYSHNTNEKAAIENDMTRKGINEIVEFFAK